MAFHAIRAGEGDVFISAGVETVSRFAQGSSDGLPGRPGTRCSTTPRRAPRSVAAGGARPGPTRARTASCPTSTSRWARPPRTSRSSRASPAQEQDEFGVRSQNLAEKAIADGFWAREITPVTLPDGTVVCTRTTARAPGVTLETVSALQAGLPAGRHGHRRQLLPAQRRRRRGGDHVATPRPTSSGITPLARIVSTGRHRPVARRSWGSARSRRPGRRSRGPA